MFVLALLFASAMALPIEFSDGSTLDLATLLLSDAQSANRSFFVEACNSPPMKLGPWAIGGTDLQAYCDSTVATLRKYTNKNKTETNNDVVLILKTIFRKSHSKLHPQL